MVNNLDANKEIGKDAMSSGSDDNGTNNLLAGCDSNDDTNAEKPAHSYVRRRKCNENVQICEKKKKRESYRRVSHFDCYFWLNCSECAPKKFENSSVHTSSCIFGI